MLLALVLAGASAFVPMRWISADAKSLELLDGSPVNCLLIEKDAWKADFLKAAKQRKVATFGVVHPGAGALEQARAASAAGVDGVVLEGDFDAAVIRSLEDAKIETIELSSRARMRLDAKQPITGTWQGVWPGIRVEEDGKAHAAPSGGPWIDTNAGFLRFLRALAPGTVWIANRPPEKTVQTTERYQQAISDAASVGARWVIALDSDLAVRLAAREAQALKTWKSINQQLAFYEAHRDWAAQKPVAQLAILQDIDSGALFSGGLLDMVAVKHTPVRAVPLRRLDGGAMGEAKMAVNVDPASLTEKQREFLRAYTRAGGRLLSGPPNWKFPAVKPDQITLGENEVKMLDDIWKELNGLTGRQNLGARLFNVSSMLSNLTQSADGRQKVLHLVNYSGYPVENITVHMLGKFQKATLLSPDRAPATMPIYEVEEGTGIDVDRVGTAGVLLLE